MKLKGNSSSNLIVVSNYYNESLFCKSISGLEIPILTITNNIDREGMIEIRSNRIFKSLKKKFIFLTARTHPGETYGSWMMHCFIKFLISSDPIATELRNHFIFKIIPMINPDGVIIGNYRSCICGELIRK